MSYAVVFLVATILMSRGNASAETKPIDALIVARRDEIKTRYRSATCHAFRELSRDTEPASRLVNSLHRRLQDERRR